MNEYALYKGDELLDVGTLEYLAKKFNVKIKTLLFYQTPTQKKRTSENKDKKCKIYEIRPEICRVYKCDKTPEEVYRNREFNNERKLPRSMRSLFYNDNSGAKWLFENFGKLIYDKNDKAIGGKNDKKRNISKNEKS